MTISFEEKVHALRRHLGELGGAVIAFSGGVDSTVLTVVASEVLPRRMLAVTAVGPSLPSADRADAEAFCRQHDIPHRLIDATEFADPRFRCNPADRCYYCKGHLYDQLLALADDVGLPFVLEGTNASEIDGHRPGHRASEERDRVVTPLLAAGLTKEEVRRIARERHLSVAEKPSMACLASRVPTGTAIDPERLRRIDAAEDALRALGFSQVRVRDHGAIARIEVESASTERLIAQRDAAVSILRREGWPFATLDLAGYRPALPLTGGDDATT